MLAKLDKHGSKFWTSVDTSGKLLHCICHPRWPYQPIFWYSLPSASLQTCANTSALIALRVWYTPKTRSSMARMNALARCSCPQLSEVSPRLTSIHVLMIGVPGVFWRLFSDCVASEWGIVDKFGGWINVKSLKIGLMDLEIHRGVSPRVPWNQILWNTFEQLANQNPDHDFHFYNEVGLFGGGVDQHCYEKNFSWILFQILWPLGHEFMIKKLFFEFFEH